MNYFESDKYYIFGAGNTAKFFKSFLDKQNKQVVAFLTSNGGGVSRNYKCTENGKLECTENGNNSAQLLSFQM